MTKYFDNLKIQFFIGFIVAMTEIVFISFNGQNLELNPFGVPYDYLQIWTEIIGWDKGLAFV